MTEEEMRKRIIAAIRKAFVEDPEFREAMKNRFGHQEEQWEVDHRELYGEEGGE